MNKYIKINKEQRICGSVSRAGDCWYKHRADQHSRSFVLPLIFKDICKRLDFLVFSVKDDKP